MVKQENQNLSCSEMMNTIEHELSKIVGTDNLNLELSMFLKGMIMDERRRALGVNLGPRKLPHLAFRGDPGMGITAIARMLGKLLNMIGILPEDKVTEVDISYLVPSQWLKRAAGGILLVNNCVTRLSNLSDYSKAVEEIDRAIIPCMDSGKQVVVIIAGERYGMGELILKYDELRNRLSNIFEFGYYLSGEQLAKILHFKVCNKDGNSPFHGFKLHPTCSTDALAKLIDKVRFSTYWQKWKNGHKVDEMLVKAKHNLDSRIDFESSDGDSWITFSIHDFTAALS